MISSVLLVILEQFCISMQDSKENYKSSFGLIYNELKRPYLHRPELEDKVLAALIFWHICCYSNRK